MNPTSFNLVVVLLTFSVCDLPSCSTQTKIEDMKALYNKLKREPDTFLDLRDMQVANENLKPDRMKSNEDVKIMLYRQGFLKTKNRGNFSTLHFSGNSEFALYANLVHRTRVEDEICGAAVLKIKSILLRQMPPEIDDFKSLMLALDTVLNRVPRLFTEWELRAIFGTLYLCGLSVTIGGGAADYNFIQCEDLPDNTRMRIVVDNYYYQNASNAWDDYYRNLLRPGLSEGPRKNLLAVIVTLFYRNENSSSTIRDWYADFETVGGQIRGKYRP